MAKEKRPVVFFTEAYNANIAKIFNGDLVTATVLNKVMMMWSGGTPRKDGYNWLKDDQMASQIGVSRRTIIRAFEKLNKTEMVESKKAYILGSRISCRHFKPTDKAIFLLTDHDRPNRLCQSKASSPLRLCQSKASSPLGSCQNVTTSLFRNCTNCEYNINNNSKLNKIKKNKYLTKLRKYCPPTADGHDALRRVKSCAFSTSPSLCFTTENNSPTNSQSGNSQSGNSELGHSALLPTEEFSGSEFVGSSDSTLPVASVSSTPVKQDLRESDPFKEDVVVDAEIEKRMAERRKEKRARYAQGYKAAELAFRIAGIKKKPEGLIIKRMVELLANGYTMYDIEVMAKRASTHDYYKTQDVMYWFSQKGVLQLSNDNWWKAYKNRKQFELGGY